jgi:hypothetical protein
VSDARGQQPHQRVALPAWPGTTTRRGIALLPASPATGGRSTTSTACPSTPCCRT